MPWSTLPTYATGAVLTSAQLNASIGAGGDLDQTATAIVTTAGDLVQATGAKALARLAAVATGRVLASGGVAAASAWAQLADVHVDPAAAIAQTKLANTRRARVFNSVNQSLTSSPNLAVYTPITFDSETTDPDAWHDTATNTSRITVPVAGLALVHGQVSFVNNTTGERGVVLRRNGTTIAVGERTATTGVQTTTVTVSTLVVVAANNYFEIAASQNSGGALDVTGGTVTTFLEVLLLAGAG